MLNVASHSGGWRRSTASRRVFIREHRERRIKWMEVDGMARKTRMTMFNLKTNTGGFHATSHFTEARNVYVGLGGDHIP